MRPILAVLALASCTSIDPEVAMRLSRLDPLTADPSTLAVALVLPEGMAVIPGEARLTLDARSGDQRLADQIALSPVGGVTGVPVPQGAHVAAFGIGPEGAARMRGWQETARTWQSGGSRGAVSLGIGVGGCRRGAGPDPSAPAAALIRLSPDEAFGPLLGPAPLKALLGPDAVAAMPECGGAR